MLTDEMKALLILFVCISLNACSNNKKFNKTQWLQMEDVQQYPFRQSMLQDLTTNYKLKGLTSKQLFNLIGEPQKNLVGDSNEMDYQIHTEYGTDIDPIHTITLAFTIDKDSIILGYRIIEWKKK